jgi:hypothetical protein
MSDDATYQLGLGIAALRAQHKFLDEAKQKILKLCLVVAPVDDVAVLLGLHLRPQLEAKVLRGICNIITRMDVQIITQSANKRRYRKSVTHR